MCCLFISCNEQKEDQLSSSSNRNNDNKLLTCIDENGKKSESLKEIEIQDSLVGNYYIRKGEYSYVLLYFKDCESFIAYGFKSNGTDFQYAAKYDFNYIIETIENDIYLGYIIYDDETLGGMIKLTDFGFTLTETDQMTAGIEVYRDGNILFYTMETQDAPISIFSRINKDKFEELIPQNFEDLTQGF